MCASEPLTISVGVLLNKAVKVGRRSWGQGEGWQHPGPPLALRDARPYLCTHTLRCLAKALDTLDPRGYGGGTFWLRRAPPPLAPTPCPRCPGLWTPGAVVVAHSESGSDSGRAGDPQP